jgi:DNA recombination protein RmuC
MPDALTSLVVIALGVVAGLVVVVLVKIGTIARAADAAVQEAGRHPHALEVMRQTTADFERDLRQDLANARTEQAAGAQAHAEELGDRLSELTRTNEQRLEAVRATVEQRLDVLRSENAQKLEARCARPSTRSCRRRSTSGWDSRSSRSPTASIRCTRASANAIARRGGRAI